METSKRFSRALAYIRENIATDIPVQQMSILFTVAEMHPEPIDHPTIGERTGIVQSSVSRHLKQLGVKMVETKSGAYARKGLQLVETIPDPYGSRRLASMLSKEGEKHVKAINAIMGE